MAESKSTEGSAEEHDIERRLRMISVAVDEWRGALRRNDYEVAAHYERALEEALPSGKVIRARLDDLYAARLVGAVMTAAGLMRGIQTAGITRSRLDEIDDGIAHLAAALGASPDVTKAAIAEVLPDDWRTGAYVRGPTHAARTVVGQMEGISESTVRSYMDIPDDADKQRAFLLHLARSVRAAGGQERVVAMLVTMSLDGPLGARLRNFMAKEAEPDGPYSSIVLDEYARVREAFVQFVEDLKTRW